MWSDEFPYPESLSEFIEEARDAVRAIIDRSGTILAVTRRTDTSREATVARATSRLYETEFARFLKDGILPLERAKSMAGFRFSSRVCQVMLKRRINAASDMLEARVLDDDGEQSLIVQLRADLEALSLIRFASSSQ